MNQELVQKMVRMYGLRAEQIQAVQKGYRNESYAFSLPSGEMRNLIVYKREPGILARIQRANAVADFLSGHDFPTRRTADARILQLHFDDTVAYAALYNYLPGVTIPWEAYTMAHIKNLGAMLSRMHACLRAAPRGKLPMITDECRELCARMQIYFGKRGVRRAMAQKLRLHAPKNLQTYDLLLQKIASLPGQQPLHMDFVRGNILFDESATITGILDFEKAAWGLPIFDIARTLAFLLVDCKYKQGAKTRKYFLQSGYAKRGQNTATNSALLEPLLNFFLLYDFYKFLRHNPYEYLQQNEHFVHTRDLLLQRGVINAKMVTAN